MYYINGISRFPGMQGVLSVSLNQAALAATGCYGSIVTPVSRMLLFGFQHGDGKIGLVCEWQYNLSFSTVEEGEKSTAKDLHRWAIAATRRY